MPAAALEPTDAGRAAEQAWWDRVLAWGRDNAGARVRICLWARELNRSIPASTCQPAPASTEPSP